MSLIVSLQAAVSALQVNQRALEVTSNNIANANTEGYTRKTLSQQTRTLDGQGAGVIAEDLTRHVDENLLKELRNQFSELGAIEIKDTFFKRMQALFGTLLNDSSIAAIVTEFGNTLQALAINPEGASQRLDVIGAALKLTQQMSQMGSQLQVLRGQADLQITEAVDLVNSQLVIIDELNRNIARNIALDRPAGELQDQRDVAISKIAEQMDITYFLRDNGEVVILTGDGRALFDRDPHFLKHDPIATMSAGITHADGRIPGILLDDVDITNEIRGGRIGGLIEIRDARLPDLAAELDHLAAMLRDELNALHNEGTAFPAPNNLTGTHFFSVADTLVASGTVRIAVVDTNGAYVDAGGASPDFVDIDLTALTAAVGGTLTVQNVIDAINGGVIGGFDGVTGATASLENGNLVIRANNPINGIVVDGTNVDGSLGTNGSVDVASVTTGGDIVTFPAPTVTLVTNGISEAAGTSFLALLSNGDLVLNVETTAGAPGVVRLAADANFAFGPVGGGAGSSVGVATATASGDLAAGGTVEIALDSNGDGFGDTVIGTITFAAITLAGATAGGSQGSLAIQGIDLTRDTTVTVAGTTRTFSHFFGLNDFFTTGTNYDVYTSGAQSSGTMPLGLSGTLTFSGGFAGSPAAIAYASGDSLTDLAAAINADATLTTANIRAELVTEGSKVRLKIVDDDSNNFTLTDSGTLLSAFNFATDTTGIVGTLAVRTAIQNDPARLSRGALDTATTPAVGVSAILAGDNSVAQAMANKFTENLAFKTAGALPQTATTLAGYGTAILALNSIEAANVNSTLIFKETLVQDLATSVASVSGVNIDEELAKMILFQNAYSASARLIRVVSEMLKTLIEIV